MQIDWSRLDMYEVYSEGEVYLISHASEQLRDRYRCVDFGDGLCCNFRDDGSSDDEWWPDTFMRERPNGRLISAAPELLEALEALLDPSSADPDKFPRLSDIHVFARNAIAKATT